MAIFKRVKARSFILIFYFECTYFKQTNCLCKIFFVNHNRFVFYGRNF